MTTISHDEIRKWETVEVQRSASEAQKKLNNELRISEKIINRYRDPSYDTPFPLEYAYHLLGKANGETVLDYGCGSGDNSVLVADHGAKVIGIDISSDLIDLAKKRIALHGFDSEVEFKVGSAHELPLPDESVDVVFGMAILHHLNLELASREVFRVLKNGGRAIFLEPVRNSKFVSFVRGLIPYQSPDVSPFERPLTDTELETFASAFTNFRSRAFHVPFVNLIEVLGLPEKVLFSAIRLDGGILKRFKFLQYYASVRVIEMKK